MLEENTINKHLFHEEITGAFQSEGITNVSNTIDVFLLIIEKYKILEIRESLLIPTENYTGLQLKIARTNLASKYESYIKTIYDLLNIHIEGELKVCLVEFFKKFGFLRSNNDSFKFFEKDSSTLVSVYSPEYFDGKMPFGKELKLSYDLRNAILHKGKLHGNTEPNTNNISTDVRAFICSMLFITFKFLPELKSIFEKEKESDYSDYLAKVKLDFKKWQNRFVHLKGREEFEEILLFAKETDWEIKTNHPIEKQRREGTIDHIRKKLIEEQCFQMIIVGDAGIGKSTTMQYLALKDATNPQERMPIYLELKLLLPDLSIEEHVCIKYSFERLDLQRLLRLGKVTLFLDGLNEILPTIKAQLYVNIKKIINDYPKTFILMSSRQQSYKNDFEIVPVFALQKMNISQIQDFLKKNTEIEKVRQIILNAIKGNVNWERILGTPLMLFMLIKVVTLEEDIPDDENKIILKFIRNLYIRERYKDVNFDVDYFHTLLSYYAFELIERKGNTNSGVNFAEIEDILKSKDKFIGMKEILSFLNKTMELNIIVQDEKLYSFAHQSYQETLAGDYFNSLFV